MKRKSEEHSASCLSIEFGDMRLNDDVDCLISQMEGCDFEDLDEYRILTQARNLKKGGHTTLLETTKRYNRYLAEISLWENFEFIRDQIQYFLKYKCSEPKEVLYKLKMMKRIDTALYQVINGVVPRKKIKEKLESDSE